MTVFSHSMHDLFSRNSNKLARPVTAVFCDEVNYIQLLSFAFSFIVVNNLQMYVNVESNMTSKENTFRSDCQLEWLSAKAMRIDKYQ